MVTTLENSLAVFHKVKYIFTLWLAIPSQAFTQEKWKHAHKKACARTVVAALSIKEETNLKVCFLKLETALKFIMMALEKPIVVYSLVRIVLGNKRDKLRCKQQQEWILQTLCVVKEAWCKRVNNVWFHLMTFSEAVVTLPDGDLAIPEGEYC